jgi:hypothetical protein
LAFLTDNSGVYVAGLMDWNIVITTPLLPIS